MINPIAVYTDSLTLYWSAIVIALGIAACLSMSLALYTSYAGSGRALWVMFPPAVVFSVFFSRLLHWYCHTEQYAGFINALTDYSAGGYVLPGAILGVFLAALLVRSLGFTDNVSRLLDAVAPGGALAIAFIRLSALFNSSCRGKIAVKTPALQHLPLASPVYSGGADDYRFATFFVQFLLMLLIFGILYRFYTRRRNRPMKGGLSRDGHTARLFLLLYGAVELIMDSTRYDSSFLPFNGFVSSVQIISAVLVVYVLVYYSVLSVRVNGLRFSHWLMWLLSIAALGGGGMCEYLVQRHGDWYLKCYGGMGLCILVLCLIGWNLYKGCCAKYKTE
ncbi:MAG: prolipoprotein diacylglyceryl transferase [Oscillospiraceae bacterium]|nr:prolipoprotein diacylglyceryl transferase [Oscillospiraceae bacterium]